MELTTSQKSTAVASAPDHDRPLVGTSQSLHHYTTESRALEQRSAFEMLLGSLLTTEIKSEYQWLEAHANDEHIQKEK